MKKLLILILTSLMVLIILAFILNKVEIETSKKNYKYSDSQRFEKILIDNFLKNVN